MNMDRIKELIGKLSRLSKSSNIHEAELAASRMQDILLKYNLSMSEVELDEEKVECERDSLGGSSAECIWRARLHSGIATYNFCRSIRVVGMQVVIVMGKKHNLEVVAYMYHYLSRTIWALAKEAANRDNLGLSGRYTYLNAFAQGAVASILTRMREERERAVSVDAGAKALVVAEDAKVQREFGKMSTALGATTVKTRVNSNHRAYLKGLARGATIGIHQGVGN